MKRKLLISVLLLLSSAYTFAQEVSNSAVKPTNPVETTTPSNPIIKPLLTQEEARERRIATIDSKLQYFASHPEEKKTAESNGTIAALEKERAELIAQKGQTASTAQKPQMSAGTQQPVETVEHLNSVITAIDNKVAYVKGNEAENQKALESGWYEMMAKQRASLVLKKEALLKSQEESK